MTPPLLYAAVFAGGVLAILSPCILPVLPFVFATRAGGRSAFGSALPLLAGLVLAFAAVATAGTVGAAWVATAADLGRWVALAAVAFAGVALLAPRAAAWAARPAVRLGGRLTRGATTGQADAAAPTAGRQLVLGAATGFLWAPCAGPILALVVAGAAAGARPALAASLFATFGLGAAVALACALAAGDRVLALLKRAAGGAGERWVRRALGAAALAAALLIALGYDAQFFAGGGLVRTAGAEEVVLRRLVPDRDAAAQAFVPAAPTAPAVPPVATPDEGPLPSFAGATGWLNTPGNAPLPAEALRGKVVVVNVWTFACYNCLNALPHVKALAAKYRGRDVVVVGVHTPELARERVPANVADAVRRLGVTYPVAVDANFAIWRALHNEYWPSVYIADRAGRVRFHHFGEGRYADEDRVVAQLLAEPAPAAAPAARPAGR